MKPSPLVLGIAFGALVNARPTSSNAPASDWNSVATPYMKEMFTTSIEWNDAFWDDERGYLVAAASSAGRYDSRHTAWYATQLLARNGPGDVDRAIRIFNNVIDNQYLNTVDQWYGDWQQAPSEPQPGSSEYAEVAPYSSWDPNIRDFVGCAWLVALNDYDYLLPAETVTKIENSLHTSALGDLYRVGGVDGDNFYPCYSNPWLMSTIFLSWVGHRTNDSNITASAEADAQEFYDLWSQYKTLSEFNSPTYMGVSMWALSLWNQYAPEGSLLKKYGPEILSTTWDDMAEFYNVNLHNLAGPWDRTYGYNMQQYTSLVGAIIWGIVGQDDAPFPSVIGGMYHQDDFAFYPLFALAMPEMVKYLSAESRQAFTTFPGEHSVNMQVYSPPWDHVVRNITAWISENVTIGAESLDQIVVGGASIAPNSFNPAVIQWAMSEGQIGSLNHYPTQYAINAVASPGQLYISYPNASGDGGVVGAPTTFEFLFSGFDIRDHYNVTGLEGLPYLSLNVTTNASPDYTIIYDDDQSLNDFIFYNITYTMPTNYTGDPYILLQVLS